MASEIHMKGPVCLIKNSGEQLEVYQEALDILSAIQNPVVVVAIVGFYHTGKSYLMNKLAGKQKGFSLGSTVQSHTKGIWMWCMPHPEKPEHTLVLLDTEGLKDMQKGDNQNDCWIFALAVLLSSTFIYNSIGTINQQAMDQLHYVTELTDLIKSKSSPDQSDVDNSANFVGFFPIFVWTLRDFSLDLEFDGESITPDEYLETSLALRKGTDENTKKFNMPRLCIRKFFPKRKCFIFDRPGDRKQLSKLEWIQEDQLNKEFVEQVAEFTSYIFSYSGVKTLSGGITVNGPRLKSLVQTYVSAICSGELPCMENAVLTLAQIENSAAVQKAITYYEEQMNQKIHMPTETLQELLDLHRTCEREAIEVFMKNSFKDVDQKFQEELGAQLEAKRDAFVKKNMDMSSAHCSDLLEGLFAHLEEEVKQGTFYKPGGYYLFLQRKQELEKKYIQTPGKGLQAEVMLRKYFESKEDLADTLLKMDQSLTEKEKQIEMERIKAEAAEAANRALAEMQKKHEMLMEQKEQSYQEHMKQLTEKMEQERKELMAEQQRIISLKLQEQERLLKQGFQNESLQLRQEIEKIKNMPPPRSCTIL
ncbi:guanylate-binding protein 1 isoform X1 [Mus musculus]|uniref:Guanylate binding protein 1 n=1 Tax=Mus musculus TaxID=10090 RepID=A4UUI2_MOUSE|nr:guanylate-binding protein 1 [Mus musculus]XP_030108281.1 guanylate-binding protein 1 isoform X1 [Mus musculus]ABO88215.1 guanylate binding protein 1 [Mus musculus]|eukprot:NP_034389.2 guanylate-binding protein 1 [Mus musculus]